MYIDDEVAEKLREWIENKPKEEDAVFVVLMKGTSYGKRISVRSVEKLVKKYAIAGTPDIGYQITPHKLRATYATNMLKETEGNVALVQAELNHSSPTTTMLYADVSVMDKKGARNILMNRDME